MSSGSENSITRSAAASSATSAVATSARSAGSIGRPASTASRSTSASVTRAPCSPRSRVARGDVGAPPAPARDLELTLAERRLAEDAERLLAIGEPDLADAEARRLLEEDLRETGCGNVPHLDGDGRAALGHADHRGM